MKADLSDLGEKIQWCKEHDDECRQIAACAAEKWEKYLSVEAIRDYGEMMLNSVSSVYHPESDNLDQEARISFDSRKESIEESLRFTGCLVCHFLNSLPFSPLFFLFLDLLLIIVDRDICPLFLL